MNILKSYLVYLILLPNLNVYGQFEFGKYVNGAITDQNDSTYEGQVSLNYHSLLPAIVPVNFYNHFYSYPRFRRFDDSTSIKLKASELRYFTMEKDTFIVLNHFWINRNTYFDADIVRMIHRGKINLYVHYSIEPTEATGDVSLALTTLEYIGNNVYDPPVETYIIEMDGEKTWLNRQNYKKRITLLLEDRPDLVQKIKDKTMRYDDLPSIIESYNLPDKPQDFISWINERRDQTKPCKLIVFRTGKKQSSDTIRFQIGTHVFTMPKEHLISTEVTVSDRFLTTICPSDGECVQLEVPSFQEKCYVEASRMEEKKSSFVVVENKVGEFYENRISFLMEKNAKK